MTRKIVKKQPTKIYKFCKYKTVGWSLQIWRFKIRWNIQDAYYALSFEWGPYNIV